jgi:hypothetical protein
LPRWAFIGAPTFKLVEHRWGMVPKDAGRGRRKFIVDGIHHSLELVQATIIILEYQASTDRTYGK